MKKRVVVTGLGCVSPVGNNVADTWSALIAGKSGAAPITHFDASRHKTKFAAEVKGFDGPSMFGAREARKMDRFVQFATAATLEALAQAKFTVNESNRDRVGILSGSGIGGIRETQELLDFCGTHGITADVERIDIASVNEAWGRMQRGDVRYRFVIDMATLK